MNETLTIQINKNAPLPIYEQIKEQIRKAIKNGVLTPQARLPGIFDLARMISVSPMTVRHAYVDLSDEGFIERRHGSGTFVCDHVSRTIGVDGLPQCPEIGVLINDFSSVMRFAMLMLEGVDMGVREAGGTMHLLSTKGNRIRQAETPCLHSLIESARLDGLLIGGPLFDEDVNLLRRQRLPFVLLDADYRGPKHVCSILIDDKAAAQYLVRKAITQGSRCIGFLLGPLGTPGAHIVRRAQRLQEGCSTEMNSLGITLRDEDIRWSACREEDGYNLTHELLSLPEPPDSLIVNGDALTQGALRAAIETGRHVPDDMPILNYADHQDSPCAAIVKPLYEMGSTAIAMLLQQIAGENTPERVLIPINPTV